MFFDISDPDTSIFNKNSRKTLISTVLLLLYDFLSLKNNVKVPSNIIIKNIIVRILNFTDERAGKSES